MCLVVVVCLRFVLLNNYCLEIQFIRVVCTFCFVDYCFEVQFILSVCILCLADDCLEIRLIPFCFGL